MTPLYKDTQTYPSFDELCYIRNSTKTLCGYQSALIHVLAFKSYPNLSAEQAIGRILKMGRIQGG